METGVIVGKVVVRQSCVPSFKRWHFGCFSGTENMHRHHTYIDSFRPLRIDFLSRAVGLAQVGSAANLLKVLALSELALLIQVSCTYEHIRVVKIF